MNTPSSHRDRTLGLWLGVLGVAIFAVTLPATRLATGTSEQPQLSPWFVTVGRAALAGLTPARPGLFGGLATWYQFQP